MSARTKKRNILRRKASRLKQTQKKDATWREEINACLPIGLEWEDAYLAAFDAIRDLVEGTHFAPVRRRVADARQLEALRVLGYTVEPDGGGEPDTYTIDFRAQLDRLYVLAATADQKRYDAAAAVAASESKKKTAVAPRMPRDIGK